MTYPFIIHTIMFLLEWLTIKICCLLVFQEGTRILIKSKYFILIYKYIFLLRNPGIPSTLNVLYLDGSISYTNPLLESYPSLSTNFLNVCRLLKIEENVCQIAFNPFYLSFFLASVFSESKSNYFGISSTC